MNVSFQSLSQQVGEVSARVWKYTPPTQTLFVSERIQDITHYQGQDSIIGMDSYTDADGQTHTSPEYRTIAIKGDSRDVTREVTPEYQIDCDRASLYVHIWAVERSIDAALRQGKINITEEGKLSQAVEKVRRKIAKKIIH